MSIGATAEIQKYRIRLEGLLISRVLLLAQRLVVLDHCLCAGVQRSAAADNTNCRGGE